MEAKELRIGNAYKDCTSEEVRFITSFSEDGVYFEDGFDWYESMLDVTLTQDIIIKLGYESLQELISDMIHNAKHPISDNVGFWVATISGLRLHELQNLYFSIKKEELTFKQ